jgi:nucleoside diphosphate kinase
VNLQRNSVHGSDSEKTAKREIALCFKKSEIVG